MTISLYAGFMGVLLFLISIETIKGRRKHLISVGTGKNNEIGQLVAANSNFVSYVPILLILLYLCEISGKVHPYMIHTFGTLICLGRLFHYLAFRGKMNFTLRKLGMYLTLWPLLILSLWVIKLFFFKG